MLLVSFLLQAFLCNHYVRFSLITLFPFSTKIFTILQFNCELQKGKEKNVKRNKTLLLGVPTIHSYYIGDIRQCVLCIKRLLKCLTRESSYTLQFFFLLLTNGNVEASTLTISNAFIRNDLCIRPITHVKIPRSY